MHPRIVALASLLGSAIAAPLTDGCHDYVLISARGTGEAQGPSQGFVGMISETLAALPNGVEYDAVYPAASDLTQITTYFGANDIKNYINNGYKSCPNQKYAVMGYSQGATVVLEAAQNLSGTAPYEQLKAILTIGNPYQVKNQASTVDQNGGSVTRPFDGILLALDGVIQLNPQLAQDGRALNICYIGDPVCSGIGFILSGANHLAYGPSDAVQALGAKHLISKLS